ncbi:mycofactocin precursor MftA [Streptomyces sp. NPDC057460]
MSNVINSAQPEQNLPEAAGSPEELIEADDLIEEISIDGMCGVY